MTGREDARAVRRAAARLRAGRAPRYTEAEARLRAHLLPFARRVLAAARKARAARRALAAAECAVHKGGRIGGSGYCDLWPRGGGGAGPCVRADRGAL